MKIIIVDDESVTRQWVKRKIEEIEGDHRVVGVFPNAQRALEYYKKYPVEVIFTDIRMTPIDGLEFLEEVGRIGGEPYQVILSAYDEFQYARQAMQMGIQEFVLKPEITRENIGQILKKARGYLESRKEHRFAAFEERSWEEYLAQYLEYREKSGIDLRAELKGRGISLPEKGISLMLLTPARTADKEELLELLEIYRQEELGTGGSFLVNQQDYILLYHSSLRKERQVIGAELADLIKKNLGLDTYIGFSAAADGVEKIPDLYRQAVTARDNRIFCGICGVKLYEEMVIHPEGNTQELFYSQEINDIIDSVEKGAWPDARNGTEHIFELIKENTAIYPAYVKALCGEILSAYIRKTRAFSFKPEYEEGLRTVEKLFARSVWSLEDLKHHMLQSQELLADILEERNKDRRYSEPVQQIMQYARLNYGRKITMEEIASRVHLNKSYVSALFRKETGKKFSDFLQQVRLEASASLLRDTRIPVQKIAEETGFVDAAYFSRVFKERYGRAPAEYRKEIQK